MRIVCLMDDVNHNKDLKYEHGMSLYIEDNDKKYLLDCGASGNFLRNAEKLGVKISDVEYAFLSHNHYDHANGFKDFFENNQKAKLYLKDEALFDSYAKAGMFKINVGCKNSGIRNNRNRVRPVEHEYKIGDVYILSDSVGDRDFFCQDDRLLMKKDGKYMLDDFSHESFLAVEKKDKVHVISSCSHRGIVNILNTVKKRFDKPIGTVYAGLHMKKGDGMNCSDEYFFKVLNAMDEIGFEKLYTCHCTGLCAYKRIKEHFGDRVDYASCGEEFVIE